ncbi:efflux transporter outer membrane subunit [Telmatospirillum sp.]|uniref:efflux transporter outer membrane subunit n=1 Tax=Telmatospirillum sp. TaxID=2079197 RepID=UPI0028513EC6|nr:efflux transporter outer membrane subunit [Telmatospirillum sp.]MDR3436782.1 efflux transporter outer membrane subunit [Telmatospirillum sp.]
MTFRRSLGACGILGALVLTAGCTVGPDFQSPATPEVTGFTPEPMTKPTAAAPTRGGAAQYFNSGQDIPGQWWALFHSPALDRLITQSLAANPDLKAAQAALRQAQESAIAQGGGFYPSVDGSFTNSRQRSAGAQQGQPNTSSIYTVSSASLSVTYDLDVFGATARGVESAEAAAEYQQYQVEATALTLTSSVVTTALGEASLRAQIAATQEIIDAETQQLDVVRRQFTLGGVSQADVLAQESTLAQTRASLPPLEKQLAQTRNSLTMLAGRFPSQEVSETFELASLDLPQDLPVSLPSQLVHNRPDIRAAEATLHQANADLGVAIANQFPKFSLSAGWGSAASGPDGLFGSAASGLWSLSAGVTQPIFHGGTLEHKRLAAEAGLDKSLAQYQSTVLKAFQDVANALRALQSDADALKAELAAERSAAASLELSRSQFSAGAISYLSLLNAERTYQEAHISLVKAQAARYSDTAVLFQALGGGWWNRTETAAKDSISH